MQLYGTIFARAVIIIFQNVDEIAISIKIKLLTRSRNKLQNNFTDSIFLSFDEKDNVIPYQT